MTRPEIIRAGMGFIESSNAHNQLLTCVSTDSIDLQDQNAPSAQDHTRQPTHPAPRGVGPPAPHQAEALREVAAEAAEQIHRSPRVSKEWTNGDVQQLQQYELAAGVTSKLTGANLQQQDNLAVAQNGGLTGSTAEDAEMADAEGDDGMDDDMMDKISSSPSIDDGGCSLPHFWPQRSDFLSRTPKSRSVSQACGESSSLFVETPEHFPLRPPSVPIAKVAIQSSQAIKYRHHQGEYLDATRSESNYEEEPTDDLSLLLTDALGYYVEPYDGDFDLDHFSEELLVEHLKMLNQESENDATALEYEAQGENDLEIQEPQKSNNESKERDEELSNLEDEPEDEHESGIPDNKTEPGVMTIPYESSEDEDDDYDIPYSADSRFVDSGWGGECLQDSEDIDFEFVYALHTFVATVEGQANATKGDTMVLLDDSNSYWWLVRVVKDSSIG
jgi:hypothetical protein